MFFIELVGDAIFLIELVGDAIDTAGDANDIKSSTLWSEVMVLLALCANLSFGCDDFF